ncbi:signal peptidase I [Pseudohongiella sp. SYSU M77423]|uniref:signal peptidase I n=1 Tax=unclassified Pseudohongiella TaxID=2629611 RepID=UPI000E90C6E5|nr:MULTISPECIES: signal peptidase I [unclassified Pseudohongiella]MDH7943061.1 signal peptidase I [Pseudohongiella sp. SYSU M77423]MEC8860196.1 signal peptidase I [Pseudomonadota bacterium]HBX37637.1 signal peptidase I [Pseudohongiella sp.]|tara:strand:+ start:80450 stop:81223 length:774 start_codon:yes stop_codon:yes gene_type:complete
MDIDFSLVLVVLVAICGFIWLLDRLLLAKGRKQAGKEEEPVVVEYAKSFFPVLVIVLLLRSFVVEPFQIPSGSMIPTLEVGDFILVNKYHYGLRLPVVGTKIMSNNEPQRGEVMVFFPPHQRRYFIKRVIGLPGDTIEYENKVLRINGEAVDIDLVGNIEIDTGASMQEGLLFNERLGESSHQAQIIANDFRSSSRTSWVVPAGHYFMMGDNRDNSADSRVWGPVPEENIVGKAFAVWMHKEPGLNLPTFSRNQFIN